MKSWHTEEWKEKREEILKNHNGKCQICGSDKKPFVIHHNWNKKESFMEAVHNVAKEKGIKGIYPTSSKPVLNKFADEHPEVIEEAKTLKNQLYLSLDKDVLVICKKCHFLIHKGYHLCRECLNENKIEWTKYTYCYKHYLKNRKENNEIERLQNTDVDVKTPCGKMVKINALGYEVMGVFEYCHNCHEYCSNGCKIYQKWKKEHEDKELEEQDES